ncbi:MAG: O-antigen polymerase [Acinetobacter johnsonii]
MSYLGLFLAFISSLPCMYLDWKAKSPMVLFWFLNIPFLYIPFFFFIKEGFFHEGVFVVASNFIIICNLIYFFLVLFFGGKKDYLLDLSEKKHKNILIYLVGFSILFIFFMNGINLESFLESNLTSKRDLGVWYIVLLGLSAFIFSQFIYAYENKKIVLGVFIISIFLIILLYFRSRSIIGLFFLPLFFYILFFDKSKRYLLLIFVPFIFILSQLVKAIRYQGSLSNSLEGGGVKDSFSEILAKNFTSGDLSIVSVFFQVIEECNISTWCGNFTFFQKIFSKFYFWKFDGKTIEYELYDSFVTSGVGGSLHPTSYGYSYADAGGFIGVIYFIVLFFSRFLIHRFLLTSHLNYLYFGFIMYFVLFFSRGSVYNGFVFLVVVMLFDILMTRYRVLLPKRSY